MRSFNVGFIVLFITMLVVPVVCIDLSSGRVSVEENRMLANPPEMAEIKNRPGLFIRHFEDWFKDSTGFREQLITLYNVYGKNTWFGGNVYSDGQFVILIGEEGHHYNMDNNGRLISKFQGEQILSDEQLSAMAVKLEAVKTYLDKRDIPFTVMFCADKETIYPEYVPKSIKRGPEPVQLDVITGYLREHTSIDVFNIKDALEKEKRNHLLYPLIDTMAHSSDFLHYNEMGAFFAYRELMNHINRYFPDIVPYELSDLDVTYDAVGIPTVSLKEKHYTALEPAVLDDIGFIKIPQWSPAAFGNMDSSLPSILVFYDSYAHEEYIGKYLAQHFGKAVFIHYTYLADIDKVVSRYKPDMVVIEAAERGIDTLFFDSITRIPELPAMEE